MYVSKGGLSLHSTGFLLWLILQIAFKASSANEYSGKPIPAAVNSRYSVSVKKVDLPSPKPYTPGTIEVKGAVPSFVIKFNSASSRVNLFHEHQSEKVPLPKESYSEDEPQILRHEVSKPIYQEVHEIISPVRRIVQEIKPVIETIDTIISRASSKGQASSEGKQPTGDSYRESNHNVPLSTTNNNADPGPLNDNFASLMFGKRIPATVPEEEDGTSMEQAKPDLVLDEENLIDNSLYNGNSEIELKYVSPNGKAMSSIHHNDVESKLYKDR